MATAVHKGVTQLAWKAQAGPQEALLACPIEDVFYGGARGGGKTDGLLGDWLAHAGAYGKHAKGILFRRTYPEHEEIESRAREIFPLLGALYNENKHTWTFRNGATLKLRMLQRDKDADKYQGHQYTWEGFDDAGNWPSPDPIDKLWACLRSPHGVPCFRRVTGNPGGVGHQWLKLRYIDPAPPYTPHEYQPQADRPNKITAVFIPARLEDNPALIKNDPGYEDRLAAASGPELYKAWRYGVWNITAGGFLTDVWDERIHVRQPFEIPKSWTIDRSFDWGSAHPFSVGWWAEASGEDAPDGNTYPRGSLVRIAEWYGWTGKPNEGNKMLAVDIAKGIKEREEIWKREHGWVVKPGPADTNIFNAERGVTMADDMAAHGIKWYAAKKGPGTRKIGWERLRRLLTAAKQTPPEEPGLWVFDHCVQWIRTVPALPRDERDWEEVDTNAEDHAGDETRYRIMAQKRELVEGDFSI